MLTYDIEKRGKRPIYEYLYLNIREDIKTGKIAPREKLPSKRMLAAHLNVSVISVKNAYEQLLAEGYIESYERRGYFAADLGGEVDTDYMPKERNTHIRVKTDVSSDNFEYDLSFSAPTPTNFPFSVWSRLMRRVLSEQDAKLLHRVESIGIYSLREAISKHLMRFRGMETDPECIVIGAGTEYLYNLIIQLLGRERIYALESPGYKKMSSILELCGVDYVSADIDESGMSADISDRATIFHLSPSHQYPTGVVMPAPRRRELLRLAAERNGYIIEDDYDSEFRFDVKPVPSLFSEDSMERVIYVNTFSETISPSIRISYMILPRPLMERLRDKLSFYSCTVPSFEQYTLALFISEGYFEKHIGRMRLRYKQSRDVAVEALSCISDKIKVISPTAGSTLIMKLKTNKKDDELSRELLEIKIKIAFVSDYLYKKNNRFEHMALINFTRYNAREMADLVRRIAEIL
jgi:GntR family transcriptional regulator/MocR family aminotransferase